MIVIGIDPHMKTHTAVAVDAASGRTLAEKTVSSDPRGHEELLLWARALGPERCFAIEDCRHVSSRLERHLLPRGERLVRVPPKLMAGARSSARTYGKSDPIDAACVARAALREPDLPKASLAGPEQDVRLLVDHRDDLVGERQRIQKRLRWNLQNGAMCLRGIIRTDEVGDYRFRSIKPASYPITDDGPVGGLLRKLGRHPYRPAHIHFIVSAEGYRPIVTQIFAEGDEYLESDTVFGVKDSLVAEFVRVDSAEEASHYGFQPPFYKVEFNFILDRAS